jgi:hypothetical protein
LPPVAVAATVLKRDWRRSVGLRHAVGLNGFSQIC